MNNITTDLTKGLRDGVNDLATVFTGNGADLRIQAEKLYNTANHLLVIAKNLEILACASLPSSARPQRRRGKGNADIHLANQAVSIYHSRRRRESIFADHELFGEPGWDILLDLFIARVQRRPTSVTSACIGSAVPSSTALRWLGVLESLGLIVREVDPLDRRRAFLALSDRGYDKMIQCLSNTSDASVPDERVAQ